MDTQGRYRGALAFFTDITARRQAEDALQQSEERYRRIVETAHEGIWTVDADTRVTFVNERMAEMLGYTREEMVGLSAFAFTDAVGQDSMEQRVRLRRQGVRDVHEVKYRRKDGSTVWVRASGSSFFDAAGQYTGALGMFTDITAHKQEEERQRRA